MTDKWEANVGQLRLVGGARQDHPKNMGYAERRSLLPIKSRGKGQLYVLVELSGEPFGREELCEDLVTAIAEEYFHSAGTITYGLRQAILLANAQLLRSNARTTEEHRVGGAACVVMRDSELYIAQAGWPMVYLIHDERVEAYPDTTLDFEDASMLGQRASTEVRLFRSPVHPGDMVLVVDGPMARQLGSTRIGQVVSGSVSRAIANLEMLAPPEDCSAMVIQAGPSAEEARGHQEQWTFMPIEGAPTTEKPATEQPAAYERETRAPSATYEREAPAPSSTIHPPFERPAAAPSTPAHIEADAARTRTEAPVRFPTPSQPESAPAPSPGLGGSTVQQQAQKVFSAIAQGTRTLGERLLPDQDPRAVAERRRRASRSRRSRGQAASQPQVGIIAALAIPIIALIIVGGYSLYRNWSTKSQFEDRLEAAELERDIALGNAESPAMARDSWLEVISLAQEADAIQPADPAVQQLIAQASAEIDRIDGVTRLGPAYRLYQYATVGSTPSRIIVAGLDVYVLDRGTGRVYHHALNEQRNALRDPDADQVLLQEAQQVGGQTVGILVDIAWMKDGGERQAGALLILDRNGTLVEYDPSWDQLRTESLGGRDEWRAPMVLRTFDSNLYLLDPQASQIFKYPDQQFANAPAEWLGDDTDIATAIDMGIDGHIYVLHDSGKIDKYYAGEATSFTVSHIPKPLINANAFYVDTDDVLQYLYVADASEMRVVQLEREGEFVRQLRPMAEAEDSFRQLNGLYVDEIGGRLYYTTASALYVANLPPVQR
jgi:hypothetical protein